MAPRFVPTAFGKNSTRSRKSGPPRRKALLGVESLDRRIMLSSSPVGGVTGPIDVAPAVRTLVAEVKPHAAGTDQSEFATSPNWSGYVAESPSGPQPGSVTAVAGSWVVPTVTGLQGTSSYSSAWVGIDGFNGSTVEQVGTEQDFTNGVPTYRAWWEMYSTGDKQLEQVITGMTISPGDSITALVQYMTSGSHGGQFFLSIMDNSRPNDAFAIYTTSAAYQNPLAQRSTAEWIVEAPTNALTNQTDELANFGTVTFTNATATINGQIGPINSAQWQSTPVNMVSNGVTEASTSALSNPSSSTASFSVSFALQPLYDVDGMLYTLQNDTVYSCPAGQSDWSVIGVGVQSIALTPGGQLWAVSTFDVLELESHNALIPIQAGIQSIAITPDGRLWALTTGDMLQLDTGTALVNVQSGIQAIATTPDGRLWALTTYDMLQLDTGTALVNVQSGIRAIATTPDGRLWALTTYDMLQLLTANALVNVQSGIQEIATTPDGRFWTLTTYGMLQVLSGTQLVNVQGGIQAIVANNGQLWALTTGDVLDVLTGSALTASLDSVTSSYVSGGSLYARRADGSLWVYTSSGWSQVG
jgi:hypothetical protein